MDKLLRIASVLDKSGHYELSDKLFSIAQNQNNFLSGVKNFVRPITKFLSPNTGLNTTLPKAGLVPNLLAGVGRDVANRNKENVNNPNQGNRQITQSVLKAATGINPVVADILKDAPVELIKLLYQYGLEKLESNEGMQGFINLITTKYGPKFDDFLSKLRNQNMRKFERLPPKLNKDGSLKLYTMGNNQAFENFLQSTNKLSPNAKNALRGLMQSTGKNLQNISKSLESFAGSPQAQ
jgi:hypothetical protein